MIDREPTALPTSFKPGTFLLWIGRRAWLKANETSVVTVAKIKVSNAYPWLDEQ